jgi:hypothetical protein
VRTDSAQVYDGPLTDITKRTAELEKRVRDLEYALLSMAGSHLVGASLCDATTIDSQGLAAAPSTVLPLPDETRGEPLMAEEGYSAPVRADSFTEDEYRADPRRVIQYAEQNGTATVTRSDGTTRFVVAIPPAERSDEFRPGDRCCVYTGGDPCVKPGTVEGQEHDGRWLVSLDRAGKIRVTEAEMVLVPESWR